MAAYQIDPNVKPRSFKAELGLRLCCRTQLCLASDTRLLEWRN